MKIISVEEMYTLDQQTCDALDITSFELMQKAAHSLNNYLRQFLDFSHKVVVLAGKGNNGGDAIILHQLIQDYTNSSLYIFGKGKQSLDNKIALSTCQDYKVNDTEEFLNALDEATHVIDGLFGIGFKGELEELSYLTEKVNDSEAFIYSVDIPSGVDGNNGIASYGAIEADETLVIEHLKYGNILQDGLDNSKKNTILKVGIKDTEADSTFIEKPYLFPRKHNSHKYNHGSIMIVGGSHGMTGAPILAGLAAYRSGAGLVHMSILDKHFDCILNAPVEMMVHKHRHLRDLQKKLVKKSAIVFGMGLGRKDSANDDICKHLVTSDIPTVIDADGIYYLKKHLAKVTNNIVITPHYGELAILLDKPLREIQQSPIEAVKEVVENPNITIILKGPTTIIANKDRMVFSSLGNPGMATAGSGDVLAGIVAKFLTDDPMDAAIKGVYVHSFAGNEAKNRYGEESLMATDIIEYIPEAIKKLQS